MSEFGRADRRASGPALSRWLGCVLVVLVAACRQAPEHHRETLLVFGSEATIDIVDGSEDARRHALATIAADLNRMHRDWHAWEPGTLTALNAALASGDHAVLPASIRMLIDRSRPIALRSDGLFNPAIGQLIGRWGYHTSDFPVTTPAPDDDFLLGWRRRVPSLFDLVFDGDQVFTRNPTLQLDFGAIAEGAAAERVAATLAAGQLDDALITIGGDVLALGDAGDRPWRVGLRDPFADQAVFATVELHDREVLFSSGNYARFRFAPDGGRWPHVLDPRSGLPVRGVAAVSVLHDDPLLADAAATALMVGGPARFSELLNRLGLRCALLLTEQDELLVTAAMQRRLVLERPVRALGPALGAVAPCSAHAPD